MGPRRRARSHSGPWPHPAGQKKRPGPDGAPGQGFRQRFAGNKGGQRGESLVGVMRTLLLAGTVNPKCGEFMPNSGKILGARSAATRPAMTPAVTRVIQL